MRCMTDLDIPSRLNSLIPAQPGELLTFREAAEFLGIRPATLQAWTSTGRYDIPFLKIGRLVRFKRSALEAWLRKRERGGK